MITDFTDILPRGQDNAITAQQLAAMLGYSDTRQLRRDIHRARADGQPICSSFKRGGGYYLPASKEEAQECLQSLTIKAKSTFAAVQVLRKYCQDIDGQYSFEDMEP